ncbi:protein of unknown function [Paenibacillus sp. yr247]|uniref:DUF4209 domain-containing protein n=1 Tax=Paenibacillus sp. yr247 TaxID=1761880 RepID=UPI00087E83DC|nr:DUF4209 domain-containing protein [Paenibacillus sp. yr247]SDO18227.1 protein of unknown function [Paenibacillus sp. yr247]
MNLDKPEQPFQPFIILQNSRSAAIEDFSDEQLSLLKELVPEISDPELKARIADVIWTTKRDHPMAKIAVESYLKSFEKLLDPDHWPQCIERIERATQLAVLLGRKNTPYTQTIELIERTLVKYDDEDPLFLSSSLMEILLEQRKGDAEKYAQLAPKLARRSEEEGNWHKARTYWDLSSRWNTQTQNNEEKRSSLLSLAETYVKESEEAISKDHPSYMLASGYLQQAIEAFRRIGGTGDRVAELHRTLLMYQKQSISEMGTISSDSIDLSKHQEDARNKVKEKMIYDALFTLATLGSSPSVVELRKQVEDSKGRFRLSHLVTNVAVNEMGKVTERQPSMLSTDPKELEAAIKVEMYKQAIYYQQLQTQGVIDPARRQILLEHNIRVRDFEAIVSNNPFIPEGREQIYAHGLHAGLYGDMMVSIHLLIPQLENSIRCILSQNDVIVSTIDADGVQDERNLNSLLFSPDLSSLLGEDTVFDMQGLLVERFGSNLRNKVAHGLVSYGGLYSLQAEYLWWLILKFCCIYKLIELEYQKSTVAEQEVT